MRTGDSASVDAAHQRAPEPDTDVRRTAVCVPRLTGPRHDGTPGTPDVFDAYHQAHRARSATRRPSCISAVAYHRLFAEPERFFFFLPFLGFGGT